MPAKSEKDVLAVAPLPERLRRNERIAIITGDNAQDLEFFYPYYRLTEAGYDVDVITEKGGAFKGKNGLGLQETQSIEEVSPENYILLYLPGGEAPSKLRKNDRVVEFVRRFAASGKPVAALCHGPQILVAVEGLLRGKRVAAWPEIRDEVEKAGATFVDEALVEDGEIITGRGPGDLHRHLYGVLDILERRYREREHGQASRRPAAA